MSSTDHRRIVTSIATLLAVPGYVICGMRHVCTAGHMHHPIYPPVDWFNDCVWLGAMAVAAVFCWRSNLRFKRSVFFGLLFLACSRLLLGSGGSLFFLIEIPILAGVVFAALLGFWLPDIDRSAWSKQDRALHRLRIIRRWVISVGAGALTVLAVWGAIRFHAFLRVKSAPRIDITENSIPFKREIILNMGEAVVLVLPHGKPLALWCEKPADILHGIHGGTLSMGYGEQPFTPLEREEIVLAGGGTTGGEYLSHIRQGPVMHRSLNGPRESILYVNPYRISLDQLEVTTRLRLIATVTEAPDGELVGPREQVDYHVRRLRDADESIRIDAIFELEGLLLCGSTYAEPRKPFIIEQIRSMESDPVEEVREEAAKSLRNLGDPQHLLKVIHPQPTADFLNPYQARELGTQTKECASPADLEPVYRHVLTLFDSDQEKRREFAVNFFSSTKPVDAAREHLLKAFQDPAAIVRAAALHALENLYGENLSDGDPANDHQAREVAIRMLADPAPEVVIAALETSVYRGEERLFAFHVVEPFLASSHTGVRLAAIRALHFDTTAETERVLLGMTRDPDPKIRAAAAECLNDAPSDQVRERMIELLEDDDSTVRIRALQSLGGHLHSSAIPPIKALIRKERDPDVIRIAEESLSGE